MNDRGGKSMKKAYFIMGVTLLAGLALAGCSAAANKAAEGSTQPSAAVEATDQDLADDWYMGVLEDQAIKDQYSHYKLVDINLDGKPELFLSTTAESFIGGEDKACLMANINGKTETLQEIGGAGGEYWVPNKSDATLTYFSRLSGEGHITLYNLTDTGLSEISTADYYAAHHYSEKDNKEALYFIDKKEVSEEEYDSYFEQYGNQAGAITYEPFGDNVGTVTINYGTSDLYSQEEMDAAIDVIQGEFANWKGCVMHSIRYTSDDCNSKENIEWVNSLEEGKNYTQCIQFQTDFHSPVKEEDLKETAWEADQEYKDYSWTLARTDGGDWELVNYGY